MAHTGSYHARTQNLWLRLLHLKVFCNLSISLAKLDAIPACIPDLSCAAETGRGQNSPADMLNCNRPLKNLLA